VAVYSHLGYILLGAVLERAAGGPLDQAFRSAVAEPLGLGGARYPGTAALPGAVATEIDDRGLVVGRVHDENAYFGGGVCGHAGLFATIGDVAAFAAAFVEAAAGRARGRWRPEVVQRFLTDSAAPGATWRLGWDTPSTEPGVSHAGDRWPRSAAVGHTGFTGTSLWLDLARGRWVALLTNRVHPTRNGTADAIKALRRAVNDAAIAMLDHR
jgi:CubicO group peptidase (beta-lactamase class C family)